MLNWWKKRTAQTQKADAVYTAIVDQARHPGFYTTYNVPDTMYGRYELVVVHLFLVMERLRDADEATSDIARRTLERFVEDMDDCMREQGVSDTRVPKRVKQAASGFYDRSVMLRESLNADDDNAVATYFAHVFGQGEGPAPAITAGVEPPATPSHEAGKDGSAADPRHDVFIDALKRYTIAASAHIGKQTTDAIIESAPSFPDPADHLAL
ncbi:MAG: ubiquinol-cytochrome C chaperone family protein [Pseudomonadota bacterium]